MIRLHKIVRKIANEMAGIPPPTIDIDNFNIIDSITIVGELNQSEAKMLKDFVSWGVINDKGNLLDTAHDYYKRDFLRFIYQLENSKKIKINSIF